MNDIFFTLLVVLLGIVALVLISGLFQRREVSFIWLAFAAHVACSPLNVAIQLAYGGGDQSAYHWFGALIADSLRRDFTQFAPEIVKLFFHEPASLPIQIFGEGSSTGSMFAVGTALCYLLGNSLWACCMAVSVAAFFGQLCLYVGLRRELPPELHRRVMIATMFLPSVVFWSSALIKEGVALPGIGLLFLGTGEIIRRRFARAALLIVPSAILVGMIKSYILFGFVLAAATWVFWAVRGRQRTARVRLLNAVVGVAIAVGGIISLGRVFPDYSVDQLSQTASNVSSSYDDLTEGAYIERDEGSKRGPTGQLLFAPVALSNALFRPFITDIHNLTSAVNAIETTGLLFLFLRVLPRRSLRVLGRKVLGTPVLVFAAVFVLTLGVAVGLTTGNIGSISRYRTPFVPFFGLLLLVLSAPDGARAVRKVPAPVRARPPRVAPLPGLSSGARN